MSRSLEFFFDYASPYSYLASTQVEGLAARTGATLIMRPFLLGAVFKATNNVAPATNAYKAPYLFADLRRWAQFYSLPEFVIPDGFPNNSLLADRLGIVADSQGKLMPFTRAVYTAAFVEGKDIASMDLLTGILRAVGLNPEEALAAASSAPVKDLLRKNTEDAVGRGAFGAPALFVDDELFIGNDRLMFVEAALRRRPEGSP